MGRAPAEGIVSCLGPVGAAVLGAALLSGCALGPADRASAPVCRPSALEPGVEVCQDGGRISVVAAHGGAVDAETIALEGIDVDAIPVAAPTLEVVRSEISGCVAAPPDQSAAPVAGQVMPTAAVECRIRLELGAGAGPS